MPIKTTIQQIEEDIKRTHFESGVFKKKPRQELPGMLEFFSKGSIYIIRKVQLKLSSLINIGGNKPM